MHVIPFLTFGDPTSMQHLVSHFAPYLDFSAFDSQHSPENALYLDCFSVVANGISVSDCVGGTNDCQLFNSFRTMLVERS